MRSLLIILVLITALNGSDTTRVKVDFWVGTLIALEVADAVITPYLIQRGAFEVNPIIGTSAESLWRISLLKVGYNTAAIVSLMDIKDDHPIAYRVALASVNIYYAILFVNNYQILGRLNRKEGQ